MSTDRRSRDSRLCEWIRWEVAYGARLSPGATHALIVIVGFVSAHTGTADLSYALLGRLMRVSERQAQRRVAEVLAHPRAPLRAEERGGHLPCRFHLTDALLSAPNFLVAVNNDGRHVKNVVSGSGRHDIRTHPGTTLRMSRHDIRRSAYKEEPGEPGGTRNDGTTLVVVSRDGAAADDDEGCVGPLDDEGEVVAATASAGDSCAPYVSAVLELYCQLPGTPDDPTPADGQLAKQLWKQGITLAAARAGLAKTAASRQQRISRGGSAPPIGCLKYFLPEIQYHAKHPEEADPDWIDYLLTQLRPYLKPKPSRGARV